MRLPLVPRHVKSMGAVTIAVATVIGAISIGVGVRCFSGTPEDPRISFAGEERTVEVFTNGRLSRRYVIGHSPSVDAALTKLVDSKRGQWIATRSSYAPVLTVRTKTAKLNFQRERLVLEYLDEFGHDRQLATTLSSDEVSGVKQALGMKE